MENALYSRLLAQLPPMLEDVPYTIPCLSNAAALIYHTLPNINWAGFYLAYDGALWLGPFQGRPACVKIPFGKGVCGCAFQQNQTLLVPDVHAFPGHIQCDAASRSELVIPLHFQGRPIGVMDLDSPLPNRFCPEDQHFLEKFVSIVQDHLAPVWEKTKE